MKEWTYTVDWGGSVEEIVVDSETAVAVWERIVEGEGRIIKVEVEDES